MNGELINLYIKRLLKEVEELTKNRLLIETQLQFTEGLNVTLQSKANALEIQIEKLNKKKTKEVNTSEF